MAEHDGNTEAEARADRLFVRIIDAASKGVPPGLWDHPRVGRGAYTGAGELVATGVPDPDVPGRTWSMWTFATGLSMVKASDGTDYQPLSDILNQGRENPGALPYVRPGQLVMPYRTSVRVNLRTGPGITFPIVRTLPAGAPLEADELKDGWLHLVTGEGFVSAALCTPGR